MNSLHNTARAPPIIINNNNNNKSDNNHIMVKYCRPSSVTWAEFLFFGSRIPIGHQTVQKPSLSFKIMHHIIMDFTIKHSADLD